MARSLGQYESNELEYLGPTQSEVMEVFKDHDNLTTKEVSELVSYKGYRITSILARLYQKGILKRAWENTRYRYSLTEKYKQLINTL